MWRRGIFTAPALVLAVYVLLLCSRFLDTSLFADGNSYLTVVVLQLLIFLLPAAIYCKLRGDHIRGRLRIRFVGLEQLLLVLAAAMTLICGALVISFAMGGDQNDLGVILLDQTAQRNNIVLAGGLVLGDRIVNGFEKTVVGKTEIIAPAGIRK